MKKNALFIMTCLMALLTVGCTDYVSKYDDKYEYLEDESSSSFNYITVFSSYNYFVSSSSSILSSSLEISSSSFENELLKSSSSSLKSSSSSVVKSSSSHFPGYQGRYGTLADPREDRRYYKTVTIGNREWMAENLRYENDDMKCFADNPHKCAEYGGYYSWTSVKESKLCPDGWNVPSLQEWELLVMNVKRSMDSSYVYGLMADTIWQASFYFGREKDTDVNRTGFSAHPLSAHYGDETYELWNTANFWGRTIATRWINTLRVWTFSIDAEKRKAEPSLVDVNDLYMPIRCIRDDGRAGSMLDARDNVTYKTIKIGTQTWMAENLKTVTEEGSSCRGRSLDSCEVYGRLYTWDVARKICPSGWHLPHKSEFETLYEYVKKNVDLYGVGEALMAYERWGTLEARDFFDFNALPSGYRSHNIYSDAKQAAFWTLTEAPLSDRDSIPHYVFYMDMKDKDASFASLDYYTEVSVRCIKD